MTLKETGLENIDDFVRDSGQSALWKEDMSEILRRLSGRTGHSARSDKGSVTSPNGAEALPQLSTRSDRAPPRSLASASG